MPFADYTLIPLALIDALRAYEERRQRPGHFLGAVLANDLMEAMARGDDASLAALPHICSYVLNRMPSGCHGSPRAVRLWLEGPRAGAGGRP